MPAARYSACEITWHEWKQPVVAVYEVASVAVVVLAFPSIVHISAL